MKIQLYILSLISVIIVFLNIFLLLKLCTSNQNRIQLSEFIKEETSKKDTQIEKLYRQKFMQLKYEGIQIENIELINKDNNTVFLDKLIKDTPKLIYFVHQGNGSLF